MRARKEDWRRSARSNNDSLKSEAKRVEVGLLLPLSVCSHP